MTAPLMTFPQRIVAVIRIAGTPMTAEQIARKMRTTLKVIRPQISRAHSYGFLDIASTARNRHWWTPSAKALQEHAA